MCCYSVPIPRVMDVRFLKIPHNVEAKHRVPGRLDVVLTLPGFLLMDGPWMHLSRANSCNLFHVQSPSVSEGVTAPSDTDRQPGKVN